MKKELEEKNLVFRIIQQVKDRETFSLNELKNELNLDSGQISFVQGTLWWMKENQPQNNPNHIFVNVESINLPKYQNRTYDTPCRLLPTALFQYIDYLEIVEARKAASEARRLSWIAIVITLVLGVSQLAISCRT